MEGELAGGAILDDAGGEEGELVDAPAVDGQVLDLGLVDQGGELGLGGIEQGDLGGDGDGFSAAGQGELDGHGDLFADVDVEMGGLVGGEAAHANGNEVAVGGGQGGCGEEAVGVGGDLAVDAEGGVGDLDFGVRDGGSGGVTHAAVEGAETGEGLGLGGGKPDGEGENEGAGRGGAAEGLREASIQIRGQHGRPFGESYTRRREVTAQGKRAQGAQGTRRELDGGEWKSDRS